MFNFEENYPQQQQSKVSSAWYAGNTAMRYLLVTMTGGRSSIPPTGSTTPHHTYNRLTTLATAVALSWRLVRSSCNSRGFFLQIKCRCALYGIVSGGNSSSSSLVDWRRHSCISKAICLLHDSRYRLDNSRLLFHKPADLITLPPCTSRAFLPRFGSNQVRSLVQTGEKEEQTSCIERPS